MFKYSSTTAKNLSLLNQEVREVIPNIVRYDYLYDERQKPKIDEQGNPVFDDKGEQIYESYMEKRPELDENGNQVLDEQGNPVYQKVYSIVYSDIQAINASMIQKLITQNKAQECKINNLNSRLEILEKKVLLQ